MNQIHIAVYDPSPTEVKSKDGEAVISVFDIKTLTLNEQDVKELVSMEDLWAKYQEKKVDELARERGEAV